MLIATDLDGTLVPNHSTSVGAYTAEVLKQVDEAGIPVVFVTARPLLEGVAQAMAEMLTTDGPAVAPPQIDDRASS